MKYRSRSEIVRSILDAANKIAKNIGATCRECEDSRLNTIYQDSVKNTVTAIKELICS